jgi:hypothetical protein
MVNAIIKTVVVALGVGNHKPDRIDKQRRS